jgi:hypothetical protein
MKVLLLLLGGILGSLLLLLLGGILGTLLHQGEASAAGLPRRLYRQPLSGEPPKSAVVLWNRGYYTYASSG